MPFKTLGWTNRNSQVGHIGGRLPVVRPSNLTQKLTGFKLLSVGSLHRNISCLNPSCPPQWDRAFLPHLVVPRLIETSHLETHTLSFLPKACLLCSCCLLMACFFQGFQYGECLSLARETLILAYRNATSCVLCEIVLAACHKGAQHWGQDAHTVFLERRYIPQVMHG